MVLTVGQRCSCVVEVLDGVPTRCDAPGSKAVVRGNIGGVVGFDGVDGLLWEFIVGGGGTAGTCVASVVLVVTNGIVISAGVEAFV